MDLNRWKIVDAVDVEVEKLVEEDAERCLIDRDMVPPAEIDDRMVVDAGRGMNKGRTNVIGPRV